MKSWRHASLFPVKLGLLIIALAIPCTRLYCATPAERHESPSKPVTKAPIKETGHVMRIFPEERVIVVGKEKYFISDDVVVKDEDNKVMTGYLLKYLRAVDLIELIRIDRTIKEIKILEYSS